MDKTQLLESLQHLIETYAEHHLLQPFDPGKPVVRLHEPTYGAGEIWEALDSLLSTRVTMGEKVRRFEREYGDYARLPHAIMVNSGSSANLLAVAALSNPATPDRLRPGDEVIVPALSWSTTVWPLIQCGLIPVIVDVDPETLNIAPEQVERAIGPRTRGIMPVHVYGNACDMDALSSIARQHSLILIEDCCEALGTRYQGKLVGSFGRVGAFSFYFSHHITTLEGGMCVTADEELADLMRILRAHGWVREAQNRDHYIEQYPEFDPKFLFVNLGYNLRVTELQGGFGSVQLRKLQSFIDVRTENARYFRKEFAPYMDCFEIQKPTPKSDHSWFGFPMLIRESAPFTRLELTRYLNERGIETRPLIAGNIAAQPAMRHYEHRIVGKLPVADRVMRTGFTFGNHQAVDKAARAYVSATVHEFMQARAMGLKV